jgi:hypothetical protein
LLWSQWQLSLHPEASFYLLQSRALELTIGVLLARLNWKLESRAAQLLSAIGAALLIVAIFVAASFVAAVAIYHTVERPIRTGRFTLAKASFRGSAASLSAVGAVVALLAGGFEGRSGPRGSSSPISSPPNLKQRFLQGTCFLDPDQGISSFALETCFPEKQPVAILWGDSHAAHHYNGLKHELGAAGYSLGMFTASACTPIIGRVVDGRPH